MLSVHQRCTPVAHPVPDFPFAFCLLQHLNRIQVPVVYKVHTPKRNLDGQVHVASAADNGSPQYVLLVSLSRSISPFSCSLALSFILRVALVHTFVIILPHFFVARPSPPPPSRDGLFRPRCAALTFNTASPSTSPQIRLAERQPAGLRIWRSLPDPRSQQRGRGGRGAARVRFARHDRAGPRAPGLGRVCQPRRSPGVRRARIESIRERIPRFPINLSIALRGGLF